jgi:TRAP transporter TAXI family solute receptor
MGWRAVAAALVLALAAPVPAQEPELVRMGTGNVTGVYFPVGVALCRIVNQHRRDSGVRCAARPSEGSVANIAGLRAGELELGIVQSDIQAEARAGNGPFADAGPFAGLDAVMSLYPEPLTVVARADGGIAGLGDLAGKRVALGPAGSGTRAIADALLAELGWTAATFAATPELAPDRMPEALCGGRIDAFVYAVGHPALAIQEATTACDAVLVDVSGPAVDALVERHPYYTLATIPAGLYRGTPREVTTFGVRATLVARADLGEDLVHEMVAQIFADFDMLRGLDPALAGLEPQETATAALSAPLHPGAALYFRERGWTE